MSLILEYWSVNNLFKLFECQLLGVCNEAIRKSLEK